MNKWIVISIIILLGLAVIIPGCIENSKKGNDKEKENQAPTVKIKEPSTQFFTDSWSDFEGIANDSDGQIVLYEWDFDGDGVFDHSSNRSEIVTFKYTESGQYTVTFRVTDDKGATATDTMQIDVLESMPPVPPEIEITFPKDNEEVFGIINIKGWAGAGDSRVNILDIEIKIDNGDWLSARVEFHNTSYPQINWSFELDSTKLLNGTHTIYARTIDDEYGAGDDFNHSIIIVVNNQIPKQMKGTLENIEFYIELKDNQIIEGKFNVTCSLKNTGDKSYTISGPGLGYSTLDFIIYTPENTIIRYLGPDFDCRCEPDSLELPSGKFHNWTSRIGGENQIWGWVTQEKNIQSYEFKPSNYIMYGNYTSVTSSSANNTTISGWTQSNIIYFSLKDPGTTSNEQLKCQPEVKVTGFNYTSNPSSVPYHNVHANFSGNYTGADLSVNLRNLTINSMLNQAKDLGENTTILYESIKVTYYDWKARPYRIPTYAEKAKYNNEWIWALAFNRANGFEDGIGHFDLYFVSISTIQAQYISGCNSTAIVYHTGCD
jgi:hypothetical protein